MDELEQMREKMMVLFTELDNQEIINNKLVRRALKSNMSWIKKFVYIEFIMLPIIAIVWFGIKVLFNLSWYNFIFMMLMTAIDAVWDYRINIASFDLERVERNSLTDTLQKLIQMKRMRAKSFFIMMPLCALWLVWTGIEIWQSIGNIGDSESMMRYANYGGFVGLIIGIPIGLFAALCIYRKMQSTNDELIAQIEEITNNE